MHDDARLIERSLAGDATAFAELVTRHRERVFRLAVSILGDGFAGDAEEVTQEVFLRVHQTLPSFRGESKFSSWLYRVTFNQALNLKARVRYRAPHAGEEVLAGIPAATEDPVEALTLQRATWALESCIADLPEVYQSALRLHYWLGSSVAEVAEMLDVPENTVKSYFHRARRLLHVMLNERGVDHV